MPQSPGLLQVRDISGGACTTALFAQRSFLLLLLLLASRPWAHKAGDMFKDNVLCMIFALFNILREKIDLTSTQAGLRTALDTLLLNSFSKSLIIILIIFY
jgi:hypothetical protein